MLERELMQPSREPLKVIMPCFDFLITGHSDLPP
jgi:hypothetical protein